MFYLDAHEEAIRSRFNTLSLYLLIAIYVFSYYFLDSTYSKVWYGFPISLFTFIFIRCLIHRRRSGAAPTFYNSKSKAIKLSIYAAFCSICFCGLQYAAHYPILRQEFISAEMQLKEYREYKDTSDDYYWSLSFSIGRSKLTANAEFPESALLENADSNDAFVGCGCGVKYGSWGDIAVAPSLPFRFYKNPKGIEGVKLPTWLCLCFSEQSCSGNYYGTEVPPDQKHSLYYRIVGDPILALKNKQCPPSGMDFLQVYRDENGVPPNDELMLTFLFAFSTTVASVSILASVFLIHLTENFGNRITFVVLISMATVGMEIAVAIKEDFLADPMWKFSLFMITLLGSGFVYFLVLGNRMLGIFKALVKKFSRIFKDDGDSERLFMKVLWALWKFIWFIVGIFWAVFSLIVVLWIEGRCKIFALKSFQLSEEKYGILFHKLKIRRRNKLWNVITIFDAVVFRAGEGVLLLRLLLLKKAVSPLLMTVLLVFILYEFLSCIYPLVKQTYILKSVNIMLESLHPRYYNVAVIRRERGLKLAESLKRGQKRGGGDESLELQARRERSVHDTIN